MPAYTFYNLKDFRKTFIADNISQAIKLFAEEKSTLTQELIRPAYDNVILIKKEAGEFKPYKLTLLCGKVISCKNLQVTEKKAKVETKEDESEYTLNLTDYNWCYDTKEIKFIRYEPVTKTYFFKLTALLTLEISHYRLLSALENGIDDLADIDE